MSLLKGMAVAAWVQPLEPCLSLYIVLYIMPSVGSAYAKCVSLIERNVLRCTIWPAAIARLVVAQGRAARAGQVTLRRLCFAAQAEDSTMRAAAWRKLSSSGGAFSRRSNAALRTCDRAASEPVVTCSQRAAHSGGWGRGSKFQCMPSA